MMPHASSRLCSLAMRTLAGATTIVAISLVASPSAAQTPARYDYGKGMVEFRLQTSSNATSGGFTSLENAQGVYYSSAAEAAILQAAIGAGYFVTPELELGADLSDYYAFNGSEDAVNIVGLAPFLRVVSGVESWGPGVFAEASPGIFAYSATGGGSGGLLSLSLWVGGHFPLGAPVALLVGPALTRLEVFDDFGAGSTILGLKFGLSVYFPRKKSAE